MQNHETASNGSPKEYEPTAADRRVLGKLQGFVPEKVFDMHTHIYDTAFLPNMAPAGSTTAECGPVAGVDAFERIQGALYGDVSLRGNLIIFPDGAMADLSNGYRQRSTEFLKEQLDAHPGYVGEVIVLPSDSREDLLSQLIHPNIRGFKCYHVMAQVEGNTFDAPIGAYLPETAWQVADERGLCITLHMVKRDALSDPENLSYIKEMSAKYPNAKLILAHCARGFAPWTVIEKIGELAPYPNIYVDISAVCEVSPIFACVRGLGHKRVLWGSDFPVSAMRGRCVGMGDSFLWIYADQLKKFESKTPFDVALVGTEALFAFKHASEMLELDRSQVEDIFYNNAMELLGLSD